MARPDVSDERKRQILTAAARVLMRDGVEAARMEDIAQEAGLSVGGVYWYFKGKEAVIHGLLEETFNADLRELRAGLAVEGTVQARLKTYMRTSPTHAEQSPLSNALYSHATRNATARTHLLAYLAAVQCLLAELIQQGIARGELRPVEPMQAALLLMATYKGFAELAILGVPDAQGETPLLHILDMVLAGLSPAPAPAAAWLAPSPSLHRGKWQPPNHP